MIDFKVDNGFMEKAVFTGDILTITAEACFMISMIYNGLLKQKPLIARAFKDLILTGLNATDSPIFAETPDYNLDFNVVTTTIDKKEFMRQMMELGDEDQ